jgi:hypothetical protein
MKRMEDCPYRNHALSDEQTCSPTFGCSKGFDPGQLEKGAIVSDIKCWLYEDPEDDEGQP